LVIIDTSHGIYSGLTGFENNVAKYWKNGVILRDVSKYSETYFIFLVKKQAAMCKIFY